MNEYAFQFPLGAKVRHRDYDMPMVVLTQQYGPQEDDTAEQYLLGLWTEAPMEGEGPMFFALARELSLWDMTT